MRDPDMETLQQRVAQLEQDKADLQAALVAADGSDRLHRVVEGAGFGYYVNNLTTGEGQWSRAAFALLGAPAPADLRGNHALWRTALHPEDTAGTMAAYEAALQSPAAAWRLAYRIRRLDTGEERWLQTFGRFSHVDGAIISTGLAVDVTEQKRAEAALVESEARLRALTSNFPAGAIYQMAAGPDPADRRFLYVSESVEQFGGLTAAELMADPTLAYRQLEPESLAKVAAAEVVSLRDRTVFDEEVRFRRRDGQLRWARIVSQPRAQADGSWVWDGIQLDITPQKEAEQELRTLNATLEERVAARVAELAQAHEALRQAQKLESMGQLTGGVAHDFNNLLSPIIGGLDMLQRRRVGDERAQRAIGGALQSAERAKTLVQRLLAFARRQPLQPRPVDLAQLVGSMARLLESTLGPRIDLRLDLAPDLPPALADDNQVEMALLNLALNARDAMPDGGALTVSVAMAGEQLALSVADTGYGMDAETARRAVEPFFTTKGVGHGTGLGLSMVHGLAAQLGGALSVDSAPGEGTRITLRLPAASDAPDTRSAEAASGWRGAGTVLLVDDEPLVRASTAEMLADLGFDVVEASSADMALDLLRAGAAPDLLVTDHLMPGRTGAELAAEARTLHPVLPVLIISGYAEIAGPAALFDRLAKPFRRDDLEAAIRQAAVNATEAVLTATMLPG